MGPCSKSSQLPPSYWLRFDPLSSSSFALEFRCDECGRVDLDVLSDAARVTYLFARTVVGREFARPAVQLAA
jgi:hypothetical protein